MELQENVMQETKQIVGYTLGEYTEEVQKAIAQGYTMSSDNEKYPYHFGGGGGYYATFVLAQAIPEAPVAVPVSTESQTNLDNQPETTVKSNRQSRRSK